MVELREGQKGALSVEPLGTSADHAEAQLREWAQVYAGLTDREVDEVERIALGRGSPLRVRCEAKP